MSSQSQKRSARQWYQKYSGIDRAQFAQRSRRLYEDLAPLLTWAPEADRDNISRLLICLFNSNADSLLPSAADPSNLIFLAQHELEKIAIAAKPHSETLAKLSDELNQYIAHTALDDKDKGKFAMPGKALFAALSRDITKSMSIGIPGDVALFGRMMASLTETSVDGSVQVAHALSVNSCPRSKPDKVWHSGEIDFFSAVDDRPSVVQEDAGAGMIGEVSFHAPVHYRYANIAAHEVDKLMGDRTAATASIDGFINGFVRSVPTGFSHQFAHQTMPEFVMLTVRRGCPYSLISAFESPIDDVGADNVAISRQAVSALLDRRNEMLRVYGDDTIATSIAAISDHYPTGLPLDDAIAVTLSACFSAEM
jgi:CRISPR system Cascade subunit CasC